MTEIHTNGPGDTELPPERQTAADMTISEYIKKIHQVEAKSDRLRDENIQLQAKLAEAKLVIEVLQTQLTDAQSKAETADLKRDDAEAKRAEYKSVLIGIKAQLNAFEIESTPLVRGIQPEDVPAIGGA